MDGDASFQYIVSKMIILNANVLCARPELGGLCKFYGTAVVFEDFTVNLGLVLKQLSTPGSKFVYQLHGKYIISQDC